MKNLAKRFPDIAKNLEIGAEECAEIIQVCASIIQIKSKAVRFGLDDRHPGYPSPREGLHFECGDLLAMIDILVANGVLNRREINKARRAKFQRLAKYYDYKHVG